MSWQLGALAILALALAAGFWWYERARPDARIVALVGALSAFAALGRIAFAAVPNVKPTTDIVLIAGFALGGGPGFAVGALAALSSNFFFGQGPWTPWQMAGWGATGVAGAALAALVGRLRRGRGAPPVLGRWPLAVVCAVIGFGFAALQDVGDWVNYSDHSLAQLGAYISSGLGFDAVHALGCVGFALALGPSLARSLARFARRLQVEWVGRPAAARAAGTRGGGGGGGAADSSGPRRGLRQRRLDTKLGSAPDVWHNCVSKRRLDAKLESRDRVWYLRVGVGDVLRLALALAVAVAVTLAGALMAGGPASAAASRTAPPATVSRVVAYLLHAQNPDGGFGAAPGQPSNQLYAGWAALGLASAGREPASAAAYVAAGSQSDPGSLERTILVLRAAGRPAVVRGHDLVTDLARDLRRDGSVRGQVNLTAFAVLALRATSAAPSARTLHWLAAQQDRDGGFSFVGGGSSDPDDTGAALQALADDPAAGAVVSRAVAYLRSVQDRDGGFANQSGAGSNAQSTAWAVQGLIAAGIAPSSVRRDGGSSPLSYLESLVGPDGAMRYARGMVQTPVWVSGEGLMALEGKALPLAAPSPAATRHDASHTGRNAGHHAGHRAGHRTRSSHPAPSASHNQRTTRPRRAAASRRVGHHGRSRPSLNATAAPPAPSGAGTLVSVIGVVEALALAPAGLA
ncbi:MAG: prenyltransferase/squalene oxidase repeat-containing protein [Solirubrobacteraceae bacterium]